MSRGRRTRRAAVALGYDPQRDPAPRVVAAGQGELAEALLKAARAHGVPVREEPVLAEALVGLQPGALIPPEMYQAAAQVLAFLWRLEEEESAEGSGRP